MSTRTGLIVYLNRFGEQGGYGVIREGKVGPEHVFTLADVDDYHGGDLGTVGYVPDAEVEFRLDSRQRVQQVHLYRDSASPAELVAPQKTATH